MLSPVSANQSKQNATTTGVGVFIHDHDGVTHTHYFVFTVQMLIQETSFRGFLA
jgi:hypothetical protein